jgi:hypothetical protein
MASFLTDTRCFLVAIPANGTASDEARLTAALGTLGGTKSSLLLPCWCIAGRLVRVERLGVMVSLMVDLKGEEDAVH